MIKINKTPTAGFNYTPISQRDEEVPFSVYIKPLSTKQLMLLEDKLVKRNDASDITFSTGEFSFSSLKLSILSWENISDENDKPIALKKNADGTINDESLSLLPSEIISEISNVVITISRDSSKVDLFFGDKTEETTTEPKATKSKAKSAE